MCRPSTVFATALLPLLFLLPSSAQSPNGAAAQNPYALTTDYNQAMQAKEWSRAVSDAQELVGLDPTSLHLRLLANAQLYSGAPDQALASYDRALAAAQQAKPAEGQPQTSWKDGLAQIYIGKGNALLKLHRNPEAIDAYNRSAELSSNPALAYFNVCAVLYNIGNTKDTPTACRKCLQADPAKADAWFILGSVLFADSPIDAKGTPVISPEGRQALEKYLELAPDGPHAADVKAMLQMTAK
jgi:tetratricopeptide (TPR) repeat protein